MKLNLFTDEKAMSPVIGVVLMVAITVVLAGTVGIMLTNFMNTQSIENADVNMPSAQFSHSASDATSPIHISVEGVSVGPIQAGNVYVTLEKSSSAASSYSTKTKTWATLASISPTQELGVTNEISLQSSQLSSESSGSKWGNVETIVLKWQSDSKDQSTTLETFDVSDLS